MIDHGYRQPGEPRVAVAKDTRVSTSKYARDEQHGEWHILSGVRYIPKLNKALGLTAGG